MPIAAQTDDEESPAKGDNDDDEADSPLDDPLGDGVEHDAEPAPEEGIPPDHEDDLYPGNTNGGGGHHIQNGQVVLKQHCCQCCQRRLQEIKKYQ